MSLPKQVQAQAEEAARLEKQMLGIPEDAPIEGAEAGQESAEGQPVGEAAMPQQDQEAQPIPSTPDSEETWEKRYKSLQGMFNAEVPRLQAQMKELQSQLSAERAKAEAADRVKAYQPEQLVTDKDVEAFGSDLIDVIDRKAREVASNMVGTKMIELEAENQTLREQLSGVSERQVSNDRRAFFGELERLVPDYEAVNVDPGFLGWLAEIDSLSGLSRQEYLNNAYGTFDVQRTAALFNTYKQLMAPAPSRTANKLERQVAPGTSKVSSSTPANGSDRIISTREVEGFYRDVQRGVYRGNEAEQARIEAEIDLAVAEGRIR